MSADGARRANALSNVEASAEADGSWVEGCRC
jgi:hypothetical protein